MQNTTEGGVPRALTLRSIREHKPTGMLTEHHMTLEVSTSRGG